MIIYDIWLRRISADLHWESLVAKGKANVLEFREMLLRDKTGLHACTYFIVDHDYDGLRDAEYGSDIYVAPFYSVENLLVNSQVLESLLRTDLNFILDPEQKRRLVAQYERVLNDFTNLVLPACYVLYGAVGQSVGNVNISDGALSAIDISLNGVVVRDAQRLDSLVKTDRPVSDDAIEKARNFFGSILAQNWVRGKFVYIFFKIWVHLVYADIRSNQSTLVGGAVADLAFSPASLDFRSLAARSPLPVGLEDFVMSSERECSMGCS
ncbi:DUF4435 domain-containing protein [Lysobacter sp. K5869]|nr:DUF4435 domain-containing protein [Lysobacter sp. K5869]